MLNPDPSDRDEPVPRTSVHRLPPPSLRPLVALLDDVALVEHAKLRAADPTSGHCVDDAGRALALACALPTDPVAGELARRCLAFLAVMHEGGGVFRLRDGPRAREVASSDDGSARAVQGIGVAAANAPWHGVRTMAQRLLADVLDDGAAGLAGAAAAAASALESDHLRARAHAALGLLVAVRAGGAPPGADALVGRLVDGVDAAFRPVDGHPTWPWPEPRLTYSNALLLQARLAVGAWRGDAGAVERALHGLRWLVGVETRSGHLSPTPVGGWAPGEERPGFDQQPIEAWSIADAALAALRVTGDPVWADVVGMAAGWFAGVNDTAMLMWDPATGRAFDGLERDGVNRNQGAESAIAFVGTLVDLRDARRFVGQRAGTSAGQAAREGDAWSRSTR